MMRKIAVAVGVVMGVAILTARYTERKCSEAINGAWRVT